MCKVKNDRLNFFILCAFHSIKKKAQQQQMKDLYSRLFLVLLFVCCFAFSVVNGEEESNYESEPPQIQRWELCLKDTDELISKTISIAYLSKSYVNKLVWKIEKDSQLPEEHDHLINGLLAVCLCRSNFDPFFFTTPYAESDGDDMIVVCVIGDNGFEPLGVYGDEELYDLLILKHRELIPPSVIDSVLHSSDDKHSKCRDLDGYPTKDIMGQQTCIFSAVSDDNSSTIYSGPLMSSPLLNFDMERITSDCFTTVKDSTYKKESDLCFPQHTYTSSKLVCCCQNNPESCVAPIKKENHFYCYAGRREGKRVSIKLLGGLKNSEVYSQDDKYLSNDYFKDYYKQFCTLIVSINYDNDGIFLDENSFEYKITYGASDTCDDGNIIRTSFPYFCSANETSNRHESFSKTQCCNGPNLCNRDLIPEALKDEFAPLPQQNTLLKKPALYEFLNLSCDSYYNFHDLQNSFPGKKYNLYDAFNAKMLEKTRRSFNSLTYIIAKIIKADSDEDKCPTRIIKEEHVNLYFPFFNCGMEECTVDNQNNLKIFECQQLASLESAGRIDTWLCYVRIIPKRFKDFDIEAGFIEIKEYSKCYSEDILSYDYCCVNVFEQEQRDSNCTIEKMRETYLKYINSQEAVNNDLPDSLKSYTQCIQKDIGAERKCPGDDGCFEILNLSKDDKSETIKPAGCLGLAEDYTVANSPLTSLSLGCRVGENSDRCSVIQAPDGQQKIVCCCNQNEDKNGYCKTKSNKLAKKAGKSISSFRN